MKHQRWIHLLLFAVGTGLLILAILLMFIFRESNHLAGHWERMGVAALIFCGLALLIKRPFTSQEPS